MCTLAVVSIVEPPNRGHFGDNINSESVDLLFVERFCSLRGSKCIVGITLGQQVLSFVERFTILCPYLRDISHYLLQ